MTDQAHAHSMLEKRKEFLYKAYSLCEDEQLGAWGYRDASGQRCIIGAGLTDAQLDIIDSLEWHTKSAAELEGLLDDLCFETQFGLTVDQAVCLQSHHDWSVYKEDMADFTSLLEQLLDGQITELFLRGDSPGDTLVSFA